VHLAEVMSFGGNSGSPVFLRLGGMQEEPFVVRGYTYYLLGVMQGFFPEGMDFAIQVAELRGLAAQNSGLAAVIPCDKINKILSSARAQAFRDVMVANSWVADGKFTEAEPLYKTAIQTLNEAAPQHTDLANALQGYALLLRKMNRIKEAVLLEARASQIRSNISLDRMKPRF